MEDNKLWALFWKCLAAAICVVCISVGGCVAYESTLVSGMVANGADPIAARCAMGTQDTSNKMLCAVKASQPESK